MVLAAQSEVDLPPGSRLIEDVGGQVLLSVEGQQHVERIDWVDDRAPPRATPRTTTCPSIRVLGALRWELGAGAA